MSPLLRTALIASIIAPVGRAALLIGLSGVIAVGCAAAPCPTVVPATESYRGHTYEQLAAEWWQWVYETDCPEPVVHPHPLLDEMGTECAVGQASADVFFLAGTGGGPVVRNCTVPAGRALFVPAINSSWDNAGVPAGTATDDELLASATAWFDGIDVAEITVDGCPIDVMPIGPVRFEYDAPAEGNFYMCLGIPYSGHVPTSFSVGFWALVPPLSTGAHTLHLRGRWNRETDDPVDDFETEATYHLEVL